jgi:hypothetical protein
VTSATERTGRDPPSDHVPLNALKVQRQVGVSSEEEESRAMRPLRRTNARRSAQTEMQQIVSALEDLVAERREAQAVARHSGRPLGDLLIARGFMVAAELEYALQLQTTAGGRLGEIVVELGLVPEDVVLELLAEQYRIEVLDRSRLSLDPSLAGLLSEARATRLSAVPMRRTATGIAIAIADPAFPSLVDELTFLARAPIHLYLTKPCEIRRLIDLVYAPKIPVQSS